MTHTRVMLRCTFTGPCVASLPVGLRTCSWKARLNVELHAPARQASPGGRGGGGGGGGGGKWARSGQERKRARKKGTKTGGKKKGDVHDKSAVAYSCSEGVLFAAGGGLYKRRGASTTALHCAAHSVRTL